MYTIISRKSVQDNGTKALERRVTKESNGQLDPKKYIWTGEFISVQYVDEGKGVVKYRAPLYLDRTSGQPFIVFFEYLYSVVLYEDDEATNN